MKAKKILVAACSVILMGASLLTVACGKDEKFDVKENYQLVLNNVKEGKNFQERSLKIDSSEFKFYAPKYNQKINTYLTGKSIDEIANSDYFELGLLEDYLFGYSWNCISYSYTILSDGNIKTDQLNVLESYIKDVKNELSNGNGAIEEFNDYLCEISADELIQTAIYNFKKDYVSLIESSLKFANASIDLCIEVGDASKKAQLTLYDWNLEVLEDYFNLLVRELEGKYLTADEDGEMADTIRTTYGNYKKFIGNISNGSKVEKLLETFTSDKMTELNGLHEIFIVQLNSNRKQLEKLNMHDFRFEKNFDESKLDGSTRYIAKGISNYYQNILNNWVEYYGKLN